VSDAGGALRVFAAGSLKPAFDELAAAAPGSLQFDYANARDLKQRIVAGEPADVFASASPEHPALLRTAGLADAPVPFATNRLVVAVPAQSTASDVDALAAPGTRVVIEVAGIPLGDYTRELLRDLDGIRGAGFEAAVMANVVAQEQTVDAVAARLLGGGGDAAVLYATDVAARPGALRAIELPPGAAVRVTCVACAISASAHHAQATAWVGALTAPAAAATLRAAGFGPAPSP
jgi:molybdate transport system substrate-binding protein